VFANRSCDSPNLARIALTSVGTMIRTRGSSSDQSHSGATSGSAAICAAISSSVSAFSAAQSGSCFFTAGCCGLCFLIDIAFLSAGAAERDRSIRLAAQRVDTGELNTRYLPDRNDPGLSVIAPVVDPIDEDRKSVV